jgi:hypothetical protein
MHQAVLDGELSKTHADQLAASGPSSCGRSRLDRSTPKEQGMIRCDFAHAAYLGVTRRKADGGGGQTARGPHREDGDAGASVSLRWGFLCGALLGLDVRRRFLAFVQVTD